MSDEKTNHYIVAKYGIGAVALFAVAMLVANIAGHDDVVKEATVGPSELSDLSAQPSAADIDWTSLRSAEDVKFAIDYAAGNVCFLKDHLNHKC